MRCDDARKHNKNSLPTRQQDNRESLKGGWSLLVGENNYMVIFDYVKKLHWMQRGK
jgi:hypothetical protein